MRGLAQDLRAQAGLKKPHGHGKGTVREEVIVLPAPGSSGWAKNEIDMRQIHREKGK